MSILVTGGAGYIGSHTVLCLLEKNFDVVVLDNLSNSNKESLNRVKNLTGKSAVFVEDDLKDKSAIDAVFNEYKIDVVIHFAALKAVAESIEQPLAYYQNNVEGSINLLSCMEKHQVNNFIFSSSATVYGELNESPLIESMPMGIPTNPYGMTKVMIENILADVAVSNPAFRSVRLRYFNPVGAHESGEIGEDPKGIPNNLMPYISQVAVGKREKLSIFGDDYDTNDGSCERDYLHVMDLAEGHVAALDWLNKNTEFRGIETFNLGTGKATSVFEMVKEFEASTDQKVPFKVVDRRVGDLAKVWADAEKAEKVLGWKTKRNLKQMMVDTWRWQSNNPDGYSS